MPPAAPSALPRRSFAILFGASLVAAVGNTGLLSVLPAIGRQIGIPDALVAAIFSLSALLWAVASPFWAKRADVRGRKPMILTGLAGFALSMMLCAVVVTTGLHHWAPAMAVFVLFLLSRAIFGLVGSASNPAIQAYVADRTPLSGRTQAMAGLASAAGLGTVVGPAIAPLFVLPVVTLAGPLYGFALIALSTLVLVWRGLPADAPRPPAPAGGTKPPPIWRDGRMAPFLIYGFLAVTCQTVQLQTLGFMVIDKLHVPPVQAQGFTAVAMMAGAVAGLLAQWGLIRMFAMTPRDLMRWGAGLAAGANLITAFAPSYWTVVIAYALASLGYGFIRPGFTAGASLAVPQADQARAAGAIASINGLNVIFAPLFVLLYGMFHPAPFLLNAAVLAVLTAYALKNRVLSAAGPAATEADTTTALLERSDEGGV